MEPCGELSEAGCWKLYVLRCADGTLYAGITNNLERRLQQHVEGRGARYTRGRGPLVLAASWGCSDRAAALRAEARFKRLPRTRKLRALASPTLP